MNKAELKEKLIELNLSKVQFNGEIYPGFVYDDTHKGRWIFYDRDERGDKFSYKEFSSESEACDYCLQLLVEVNKSYLQHMNESDQDTWYTPNLAEWKKSRKFIIQFEENTEEIISMSRVFFVMGVIAHQFDNVFDLDRLKSYEKGSFSAGEIYYLLQRDTNADYCIKSSEDVEKVLECAFSFGWLTGKIKEKPTDENRYSFNGLIHLIKY